jgi:hypothetical protein
LMQHFTREIDEILRAQGILFQWVYKPNNQ